MVFTPARGDAPARFGPGVPLIPDIGTGVLDASVYTDPERYQRERAAVLAPSWQVICRSAELANPGDFITWAGQGETIVVTRRRDGGVSGFHNVCQHRGARIVSEPSGCARRFSCRWHNWVYDLKGKVVGVPDREDFDPAALAGLAAPAGATRDSSAYRRNILNDRECKITSFHRGVQALLDQAGGCS